MKKCTTGHRILTFSLALCLLLMPGVALAKGKGKKNFDEGKKYEQLQQWDMAAQKFALAVSAEPNNTEYKLHYLQALQKASLMFLKQGDEAAERGDFEGAYNAYRYAYQYDQGNEIARLKMGRMMDQQKQVASGSSNSFTTNRVGNVMNTGGELPIAKKGRSGDVVPSIIYSKGSKFKTVVSNLGKQLGLNVVYDDSVKDTQVIDTVELDNVTMAKALDIILRTYKFSFELVDRRTILVYADNGTNRPRFETLMVKTFYLGNVTANQARAALQIVLPPGRTMAPLDSGANSTGGNVLVIKATATELQLVQDVIDSLDKNKSEVVLDVEIYEVSKDRSTEIGNQIPTTNDNGYSLSNLGGVGSYLSGSGGSGLVGSAIGSSGALLALPLTQVRLLQSKGDNKLLYKTQIHVLDGQENETVVGNSVPVRTGATYPGGYFGGATGQTNNNNSIAGNLGNLLGGGFGSGVVDNIQYKDVGLTIKSKPTITSEGYVELKMEFETSDISQTGSGGDLLPAFTKRQLKSVTRLQDGVTSIVAGINQDTSNKGVSGVPIVSMVPFLGRFVSAPKNVSKQADIIITVTPRIVRSAGLNEKDHLARTAGMQQSGPGPSVEEVVNRAQQEEEQDRRQIAQQIPQPGTTNPSSPVTTEAAAFTQPPRTAGQQAYQTVSNTNPGRAQTVANAQPINPAAPPVAPSAAQNAPFPQDLLTSVLQPKAPSNGVGAADARGNSAVRLRLSPKPIRQQPGKSFTVAVEVSSQAQMTGADIAISFDSAKLRLKNVRDGGMFGAQPDPTYEVEKGSLIVKFKSPQSAPAVASSGRLILIEFAAIAEGSSEIAFNQTVTQIVMAGNTNIKPVGTPTQVIISRDGGATVSQ